MLKSLPPEHPPYTRQTSHQVQNLYTTLSQCLCVYIHFGAQDGCWPLFGARCTLRKSGLWHVRALRPHRDGRVGHLKTTWLLHIHRLHSECAQKQRSFLTFHFGAQDGCWPLFGARCTLRKSGLWHVRALRPPRNFKEKLTRPFKCSARAGPRSPSCALSLSRPPRRHVGNAALLRCSTYPFS